MLMISWLYIQSTALIDLRVLSTAEDESLGSRVSVEAGEHTVAFVKMLVKTTHPAQHTNL